MDLPPKEKERDIESEKLGPVAPLRAEVAKVAESTSEEKRIESPKRSCDVILVSVSDEIEERHRDLVDKIIRSAASLYPSQGCESLASSGEEFSIRVLDIACSLIILLLAMPAMIIIALLIKMFSPGPLFCKQKRVGKEGKIFTLYKFRTMINNPGKQNRQIYATEDDPRVTFIGRILRRTRLDELPQLFNVLRGEMSLVGPPPEHPYFVKRNKFLQGTRLAVKPGLTGLAQIRSFYNLKPGHRIKYDYLYIQKRSFLFNIYILLKTIPAIFYKKGW